MAEVRQSSFFPAANGPSGLALFRPTPVPEEVLTLPHLAPAEAAWLLDAVGRRLGALGWAVERHLDATSGQVIGLVLPGGLALLAERHPYLLAGLVSARPAFTFPREAQERGESHRHLRREVGMLRRQAFRQFHVALLYQTELATYLRGTEAMHPQVVSEVLEVLAARVLADAEGGRPHRQDAFASSLTAAGPQHVLAEVAPPGGRRWLLAGPPGSGVQEVVAGLAARARRLGEPFVAYHCALNPRALDHLVLPRLSVAVLNVSPPHVLAPRRGEHVLDLAAFVDSERLRRQDVHRERAAALYGEALARGISFLAEAQALAAQAGAQKVLGTEPLTRLREALSERLAQRLRGSVGEPPGTR